MSDIRDEFETGPVYRNGNPNQRRNQKARMSSNAREAARNHFASKRLEWIKNNPTVGYWTILGVGNKKGRHVTIRCECKCGAVHDVYFAGLKSGKSKQCTQCFYDSMKGVSRNSGINQK
jgi:hypothetical protein